MKVKTQSMKFAVQKVCHKKSPAVLTVAHKQALLSLQRQGLMSMCFEVGKKKFCVDIPQKQNYFVLSSTHTKLQIRYSSLSKRSFKVVYLPVPETPRIPNLDAFAFNTVCLLYTAFPLPSLFFFAIFELEWSICIEFDMQNRACKHHRQLILNNNLCNTSLKVHFFPQASTAFHIFPFYLSVLCKNYGRFIKKKSITQMSHDHIGLYCPKDNVAQYFFVVVIFRHAPFNIAAQFYNL